MTTVVAVTTTEAASVTTGVAVTTTEAILASTASSIEVTSTTRLRASDSAYYVTQAGHEVVYKCESAVDSCAVWLDLAGDLGACEVFANFRGQSIAVEATSTQEEVYPVADPIEISNISAELEVIIEEAAASEDELTPASEIWFGVEDVFNSLTGAEGWTLENVTRVSAADSRLRRLADVATYALGFKLRYVSGSQTLPDIETMFDGVRENFKETVNAEVTGGNWTITAETYVAIEDEDTDVVVASSEDAPEWATIVLAKTSTTNEYEYDSSPPRCSASPVFWAGVLMSLASSASSMILMC